MITLQFSTQDDFVSDWIRRLTKSEWSHVDCVLPAGLLLPDGKISQGGELCGARLDGGVLVREPFYATFTRIGQAVSEMFSAEEEKLYYEFLLAQVGKPYDWPGIVNFALHLPHDWKNGHRWFCSALQDGCSEKANHPFCAGDPDSKSPGDLWRVPEPKLRHIFDRKAPFAAAAAQ